MTSASGPIINAVTASGTVLVAGDGVPVLCSAHPEWSAALLSASPSPWPYPCFRLMAALLPEATQSYYDAVLEPLFRRVAPPSLTRSVVAPSAALGIVVLVADAVLAVVFVFYFLFLHLLGSLAALLTLAVVAATAASWAHKQRRAA